MRLLHSPLCIAAACLFGLPGLQAIHVKLQQAPTVDIFYESQCPYSLDFLNTTLRQVFEDKELWHAMTVKLHPFGNAQAIPEKDLSDGYHFWHENAQYPIIMCQHNAEECLGNKIQSCVIEQHKESSKHVPFILCMASYGLSAGVELTSYNCGKKLDIDMKKVRECVHSDKGHKLLLAAGDLTRKANVSYVPWLNVNGAHTHNDTILVPVCDAIKGTKPAACQLLKQKSNSTSNITEKKGDCGGSGGSFLARDSTVHRGLVLRNKLHSE